MNSPVTAVILCAGEAVRYGGALKQLVDLGGTTTVGRSLRLMAERGIPTSLVTHKRSAYKAAGIHANLFTPAAHRWTIETLLSTRALWGTERTLVLLGDVYYSDALIDLMLKGETMFYCGYAEIWGVSIGGERYEKVERILGQTIAEAKAQLAKTAKMKHGLGQLWRFYRTWYGLPFLHGFKKSPGLFFDRRGTTAIVFDETADFDTPVEHKRWRRGLRGWQVKFPSLKPPCSGLVPVNWKGRRGRWRCPYDKKLHTGFEVCMSGDCPNRREC